MKDIIALHKFFVKESRTFAAPFTLKRRMYYPIAYIKFMYYSMINK